LKHHYTLFIDEAGDDKTHRLKPENVSGNSEWLCIGGYLVRSHLENELDERRNYLSKLIGGQPGQALHYRNCKPWNRLKLCKGISEFSARSFVVCSFKKTMVGYRNERAEAAGNASSNKQYLYNFVVRLLLERVTEFVESDANVKNIAKPKIKIVMASRKGHHFGMFKAYVHQLINQAKSGRTHLKTKEIKADLLSYGLIERAPASAVAGLQLADIVVSATFQSIETLSPNNHDSPAKHLRKIIYGKRRWLSGPILRHNLGMTLYPASQVIDLISSEQKNFFESYGYNFDRLSQ